MKNLILAILVSMATMAIFAPSPATAQDCDMICYVYENSSYHGGVCAGTGRLCFDCYRTCDGTPFPIDYKMEPGHLVEPQLQVALSDDGVLMPDSASLQASLDESACKNQSLFGRLDPRQELPPFKLAERSKAKVEPTVTVPAVP